MRSIATMLCLLLAACTPTAEEYANETPVFDPQAFFNGDLNAWGVMQDYREKAGRHFQMKVAASWQGDTGTQREHLVFSDGTVKDRVWTFRKIDAHHVTGTAPDVEGKARGEIYGNALHWTYDIHVTAGGKDRVVTFDDWLYLVDDRHLFSRVRMRKYGLPVGEMTMFFEKRG